MLILFLETVLVSFLCRHFLRAQFVSAEADLIETCHFCIAICLLLINCNWFILQKESDGEDDISHLEWETVRVRFVKAAKLSKLVEALATDDGELESTFINVFLATYRTFTQPEKVLELLLQRYERLSTEKIHSETVSEQHRKTLGK